jgi:hypothetical protein
MNTATLSEQLSEIRRTRYAQVPRVRQVMQMLLWSQQHSEKNRVDARTRILDWGNTKWPGLIQKKAWNGEPFEHMQPGLLLTATATNDGAIWAFRSEHLDGVHSRTWVTEALIADLGEHDAFGVRNSCSFTGRQRVPASSPRIVRDLVAHHHLLDAGFPVSAMTHNVNSTSEFDAFAKLLFSPDRALPIVVLTHPSGSDTYLVNAGNLARNTQGLAHVFCLPRATTFDLTDLVGGKMLSVFDGAVRTYYPGFSVDADPYAHPLVLATRMAEWLDEEGNKGPETFSAFIAEQMHFFSVGSPDKLDRMPSFSAIKKQRLSEGQRTPADKDELLELQRQELEGEVTTWRELALDRDELAQKLQDEVNQLRAYSQVLSHNLEDLRKGQRETEIRIPADYESLEEWCNAYLSGRLILLSRAARAARKAMFEDVALVYRSMLLLAFEYRNLCIAATDDRQAAKASFDSKLQALHLDMRGAISKERVGEFESEYMVDYTIGQSPRQLLEWHLTKGNDKDERRCLRIYFFWDPEMRVVVVGHLPSHLRNRMT